MGRKQDRWLLFFEILFHYRRAYVKIIETSSKNDHSPTPKSEVSLSVSPPRFFLHVYSIFRFLCDHQQNVTTDIFKSLQATHLHFATLTRESFHSLVPLHHSFPTPTVPLLHHNAHFYLPMSLWARDRCGRTHRPFCFQLEGNALAFELHGILTSSPLRASDQVLGTPVRYRGSLPAVVTSLMIVSWFP